MAWSSAMCYAVTAAEDTADVAGADPYDDGWQAGDNGGFGFGPWDFDLTYNSPVQQRMDDGLKTGTETSSTHNDIGRAWTLYNPVGGSSGDMAQAGRSISPLEVGQTISIEMDTPGPRSENRFYRGLSINLNHGGANRCWEGDNCSTLVYDPGSVDWRARAVIFGYGDESAWGRWHNFPPIGWPPEPSTPEERGHYLDETDNGVRLDFTLTGPETYTWTMDSFDPVYPTVTQSGTLMGTPGTAIDWIEFELYNTASNQDRATDWYIRSIKVTAPDPAGQPGDFTDDGKVDAADYVVWRKNTSNGPLPNDEGLATQPERYNLWRTNFGSMSMPAGGTAVPEPGSLAGLLAAMASLLLWRYPLRTRSNAADVGRAEAFSLSFLLSAK
jgi:hypothetical protein